MNNQFYTMYPYMNSIPTRGVFNPVNMVPSRGGGLLSSILGSRVVPGAVGAKTFSFTNLLNGASKTLGVINQAIPVVYQIKPIWNNAKTMFRVAKELNSSNNETSNNKVSSSNSDNNNSTKNINKSDNSPQFFI